MGMCILHMILYLSIDTVSLLTCLAEQKNKMFALPFSYSKGMHNFLKVSDFRKCSSFPKYKFVMTTSTENMTMNASFLKKECNIEKPSQIIFFGTFDVIHQSDVTFF